MSEKAFQNYFMKVLPHGYRTALVNGGGFPDVLVIKGNIHYLLELKLLLVGTSGNKKLKGLYKKSQLPWHMKYIVNGGTSLYTLFKLNEGYGVIKESKSFVRDVLDGLTYLEMKKNYFYTEHKTLKELIDVYFS